MLHGLILSAVFLAMVCTPALVTMKVDDQVEEEAEDDLEPAEEVSRFSYRFKGRIADRSLHRRVRSDEF